MSTTYEWVLNLGEEAESRSFTITTRKFQDNDGAWKLGIQVTLNKQEYNDTRAKIEPVRQTSTEEQHALPSICAPQIFGIPATLHAGQLSKESVLKFINNIKKKNQQLAMKLLTQVQTLLNKLAPTKELTRPRTIEDTKYQENTQINDSKQTSIMRPERLSEKRIRLAKLETSREEQKIKWK